MTSRYQPPIHCILPAKNTARSPTADCGNRRDGPSWQAVSSGFMGAGQSDAIPRGRYQRRPTHASCCGTYARATCPATRRDYRWAFFACRHDCWYQSMGGSVSPFVHLYLNRISDNIGSRNEDVYPDANTFNPERWFEKDTEKLKLMDRTMLTFGYTGSSRMCIGKNISLLVSNASCCVGFASANYFLGSIQGYSTTVSRI